MALEIIDLVIGAQPVGLLAEALDPLDEHAAIPAAVEHGGLPTHRQTPPEAPQIGSRAFLVSWRGYAVHPQIARVERLPDAQDRTTLAGGVVAFKNEDETTPCESWRGGQLGEPALVMAQFGFVAGAVEAPGEIEPGDHARSLEQGLALDQQVGGRRWFRARRAALRQGIGALQCLEQKMSHREVAVMHVVACDDEPWRIAG